MRKTFIENLPKRNNYIDWKNCIGKIIHFIYKDIEGDIEILEYYPTKCKLKIKYNNTEFVIFASVLVNCNLGKITEQVTSNFKIEIGTRFKDEKRDITIIDKEYRKDKDGVIRKWYKYLCNKCGYEGWIIEQSLLTSKSGCPVCCTPTRLIIEGINDIPTTAPWMVKYFQGGYNEAKLYSVGSAKKIYPICPDCGRVKDKQISICQIYETHSIGCSCSDGIKYPNKFGFATLEQLNIHFETEYSPDWIKPKRYDFYFELNNKKYIVEMDGGLGHGNKVHKNSKKTKNELIEIDDYKDRLAQEHGIEVIRIDCNYNGNRFEYIKQNILDSRLNKLFDLSRIDWLKIDEFALSNLVKTVCGLKNNNPELSTNDICNITKIKSITTVRSYLIEGSKHNWCDYNAILESSKSGINNGKRHRKPVEIFKDGIYLGVFESCVYLADNSERLFGVKLNSVGISAVCTGRVKTHKGFTFKYLTKEEYLERFHNYDIINKLNIKRKD